MTDFQPESLGFLAEEIARQLAGAILEDQRFRLMVRDIVLHVHLEQHRQREQSAIQCFFSGCRAHGIILGMGDDGTPRVNNAKLFTPELKAVYMLYREQINAELLKERDEKRLKKRA